MRALEETAALARRVSVHHTGELQQRILEKAETHLRQADHIRQLLLHGNVLTALDAAAK